MIGLPRTEKSSKKPDVYAAYNGKEAARIIEPTEAGARVLPQCPPLFANGFAAKDLSPDHLIEYLFRFASFLGDFTLTALLFVLRRYGAVFASVLRRFGALLRRWGIAAGETLLALPYALADDVGDLRKKLAALHRQAKQAGRTGEGRLLYFRFVARELAARRGARRVLANTVFPLAAAVLAIVVGVSLARSAFALEVRLDGESLGYVESAQVFDEARDSAVDLLRASETTAARLRSAAPTFRLCRAKLTELQSSAALCTRLLESGDVSLTHACGVFIDGTFLCAVRNEADAVSAFERLLSAAQKKDADATVAFAEEISYADGLYPADSETLRDPLELAKTLKEEKSPAVIHTVESGDHIYAIAGRYKVTPAQLRTLNPNTDFSRLTVGQKILISQATKYVHVKLMKTRTKTAPQPYETVKRKSSALPQGATQVLQEGKNGKAKVTELVTYIDGKQTVRSVIKSRTLVPPVNEILLIGTSDRSGTQFASGFIWPTVGAYTLSSRFGYRSARISGWSFHGGVDIIKAGGHSTGMPVLAAASGIVVVAQKGYRGYGHTVVVDHGNGLQTRYAHMQPGSLQVRVGQSVSQGQQIGRIGSTGNVTGPHLHFEVLKNGAKVNPLNYIG